MDKIVEKLNGYDLLVNLLIGVVIYKAGLLWIQFVLKKTVPADFNSVATLLVCGYVVGTICQELGYWLYTKVNRGIIVKELFNRFEEDTKNSIRGDFPFDESKFDEYMQLYRHAKAVLKRSDISMEDDQDLILAAMSRSLMIASFVSVIATSILIFWHGKTDIRIIVLVVSIILALLFYIRWRRFFIKRTENVLKQYYIYITQDRQ